MTKHGWLSFADIGEAGGVTSRDVSGNRVVQFPTWTKERGRHYREIPDYKLAEGEAAR